MTNQSAEIEKLIDEILVRFVYGIYYNASGDEPEGPTLNQEQARKQLLALSESRAIAELEKLPKTSDYVVAEYLVKRIKELKERNE